MTWGPARRGETSSGGTFAWKEREREEVGDIDRQARGGTHTNQSLVRDQMCKSERCLDSGRFYLGPMIVEGAGTGFI